MVFRGVKFTLVFFCVAVAGFNGLTSVLKIVTKKVPSPYIDEIFHVPQAQLYCQNNFDKWDRKITTLPGLYLISIAIIKPLEKALGLSLCSVYGLRFINIVGTLFNFVLSYVIQQKLAPNRADKGGYVDVMSAVNVAAFPPLFFFSFLYYTDVWSTAFVLLMYLFHLYQSPLLAALVGVGAVFMRQTNIIWVGMCLIDSAWTALVGVKNKHVSSFKEMLNLVMDRLTKPFFFRVLQATSPYITVCFFFATFVLINGGIVIGDKSSHSAVFHPMQNLYFLAIAAFFLAPHGLFQVRGLWDLRHKLPLFCTIWMLVALLSEYNLIEHPYLLADNRHLAFYLWKRFFGNLSVRRLLTPFYVISAIILCKLLQKQNLVFILSLALCTIMNLTPQHLFEIRYFIIPFLMVRLHSPQHKPAILLETLYFVVINAVVFYIFLTKQFRWVSEPGAMQRIIW